MGLILLVTIPVCLLLGALPAAFMTRRQRAKQDGSFRCRVRVQAGQVPGLRHAYRRQRCFWVHDVFVIHRGRIFPRSCPLGIRSAQSIESSDGGLVAMRLHLDKGAVIKVLADRSVTASLVGPFLTAGLEHAIRTES